MRSVEAELREELAKFTAERQSNAVPIVYTLEGPKVPRQQEEGYEEVSSSLATSREALAIAEEEELERCLAILHEWGGGYYAGLEESLDSGRFAYRRPVDYR